MPLDSYSALPPPPAVDRAAIAAARPRVQSAARWFWWIAGLSVVNSVAVHSGGDFNFVLGLAVTQFCDAIFQNLKVLAVIFDGLAVAFFVGAGVLAKRGQAWAFVVGGVAYLIDGAIFAVFGDWLPAAFHAYALFCIFQGYRELRAALQAAREAPGHPAGAVASPAVVTTADPGPAPVARG